MNEVYYYLEKRRVNLSNFIFNLFVLNSYVSICAGKYRQSEPDDQKIGSVLLDIGKSACRQRVITRQTDVDGSVELKTGACSYVP